MSLCGVCVCVCVWSLQSAKMTACSCMLELVQRQDVLLEIDPAETIPVIEVAVSTC